MATLVSGTTGPGRAVTRVQPGRYRLDVEPSHGYVVDPAEPDPIVVQITQGRHWFELVRLTAG